MSILDSKFRIPVDIPFPSNSNIGESNNERKMFTATLPEIQWFAHNKFSDVASYKEIDTIYANAKKRQLEHNKNNVENYEEGKLTNKKKYTQEISIFRSSHKRTFNNTDTMVERLTLKKLKENKQIKNWLDRIRNRRDFENYENLNQLQIYLLGDNSHVPVEQKKQTTNELKFISHLRGSKKLISKICHSLSLELNKIPTIHPEGKFKLIWNILVCMSILYQLFTVTIELFFQGDWYMVDQSIEKVNYFMSKVLIFLIFFDIVLNMITGYIYHGKAIMHPVKIIKNYLKNFLFMDLLVITPVLYDFYNMETNLKGLGLLFESRLSLIKISYFFRLMKLTRTFYYIEQILSNDEKIEGVLSLLKLCFKILLTAHFFACIWFFLGQLSQRDGENSWILKAFSDHENSDWRTHYLHSLYWSITTMITVGYGDITPVSNKEVAFVIISMVIGCGMFGYSLNNIGVIFNKIFSQETELKSNLRIINRFMHRKRIDFELQGRVRQYLDFVLREAEDATCQKETKLISKLSHSLRKELLLQANGQILLQNSILKNNFTTSTIQKLAEVLTPMDLAPGEYVYEEKSNEGGSLYFISKGKIDISLNIKRTENQGYLKVKTLREGEAFGEYSFFTGRERETGAISVSYTKLFILRKKDFLNIVQQDCDDYEKYCLMRDKLVLGNDYSVMKSQCFACGSEDHPFLLCPRLNYVPKRRTVCLQYNIKKKNRNECFQRKNFRTASTLSIAERLNLTKARLEENYDFSPFEDELNHIRQELKFIPAEEESLKAIGEQSKNHGALNDQLLMKPQENKNKNKVKKPTSIAQIAENKIENDFSFDLENPISSDDKNLPTASFQIQQAKLRENDRDEGSIISVSMLTKRKFKQNFQRNPGSKNSIIVPVKSKPCNNFKESADLENKAAMRIFDHSFDLVKNFKYYYPKDNVNDILMRIKLKSSTTEKNDIRRKYNIIRLMKNRVSVVKKKKKLTLDKQPSLIKKLTHFIF